MSCMVSARSILKVSSFACTLHAPTALHSQPRCSLLFLTRWGGHKNAVAVDLSGYSLSGPCVPVARLRSCRKPPPAGRREPLSAGDIYSLFFMFCVPMRSRCTSEAGRHLTTNVPQYIIQLGGGARMLLQLCLLGTPSGHLAPLLLDSGHATTCYQGTCAYRTLEP